MIFKLLFVCFFSSSFFFYSLNDAQCCKSVLLLITLLNDGLQTQQQKFVNWQCDAEYRGDDFTAAVTLGNPDVLVGSGNQFAFAIDRYCQVPKMTIQEVFFFSHYIPITHYCLCP